LAKVIGFYFMASIVEENLIFFFLSLKR